MFPNFKLSSKIETSTIETTSCNRDERPHGTSIIDDSLSSKIKTGTGMASDNHDPRRARGPGISKPSPCFNHAWRVFAYEGNLAGFQYSIYEPEVLKRTWPLFPRLSNLSSLSVFFSLSSTKSTPCYTK